MVEEIEQLDNLPGEDVEESTGTIMVEEIINLPNEDVQKSRGSTNFEVVKFQYEWTIYNINLCKKDEPKIKSPKFSMITTTCPYLWSLELQGDQFPCYSIILNLESDVDDEINVNFKITGSINGETWTQIKTENIKFSFDHKNKTSINGGDSILLNDLNEYVTEDLLDCEKIVFLLEGECTVPIKLKNTFNDVINNTQDILSSKAIQDILHFLYTGQATNTRNLQKGLLLTSDNLELKEKYEEELFSELNIENATEIYKFFFTHGKTEAKKKVMGFIKKNGAAVTRTKGWMSILGSSDAPILAEMISAFTNNPETSNGDALENSPKL